MPNFLQKGLGNCGNRQGEAPQPVLCPFTFYMHGWVLMIYAQSFQHHIASHAAISPAILVQRKRPSMLKNDPLVVDVWSKSSNFQELREHQFHFSHIRTYHRQVKALNLPAIVHSTTHTLLCMSWMRNCTLKQVILIQWINGLHLRMGIFCHHQHCVKL